MTVRTRLVTTFAVVAGLLAVPALFAAARLADLKEIAVEERGNHARVAQTLGRMEATLGEVDRLERRYVGLGDLADDEVRDDVRASVARLQEQLAWLRGTRYGEAVSVVEPTVTSLARTSGEIEDLVEAGSVVAATDAVSSEFDPLVVEMGEGLTRLADSVDAIAQRDFDRARAISSSALDITLGAMGAALLLAVIVGGWTTRVLTRPLRRLASGTGEVAEGSFDAPSDLPYERDDEIGELSRAFRTMTYRLSELDRMKTEFVGIASHELKNPVNVVRGYAELLDDGIPGELNEKQTEMVRAVSEQTRIMNRLINRLMDISRLESGTYELKVSRVEVGELLATLQRSFGILAEERDKELVLEVGDDAPEALQADADLLRDEVLGNLVSNAIKHTPDGGRVTVRVSGADERVVFEVADTGPGIPEGERHRIFEKYYQAGSSRKGGSGLGLAVAREMVEAHGGTIELAPDAGEGATFRVVLPVGGGRVREPAIRGS